MVVREKSSVRTSPKCVIEFLRVVKMQWSLNIEKFLR
jgi:hypothetical protein